MVGAQRKSIAIRMPQGGERHALGQFFRLPIPRVHFRCSLTDYGIPGHGGGADNAGGLQERSAMLRQDHLPRFLLPGS